METGWPVIKHVGNLSNIPLFCKISHWKLLWQITGQTHQDNQMPMLFIKPNTGPLRKFNFTCRLKCCITIPPQLLCDQTVVCLEYSCFRVSTGVAAKIATNETTPPKPSMNSLTRGKSATRPRCHAPKNKSAKLFNWKSVDPQSLCHNMHLCNF